MLVERDAFFQCGEFDRDFYVAEENVDLGFRLWQQGRTVVRVSGDLARSSGAGVIGHYGPAEQAFFRMRNRLFTVIKNYELDSIYRILPSLLLEMLGRVWDSAGLDGSRYRFGPEAQKFAGDGVRLEPEAAAGLLALDDLLGGLDRLRANRRAVQSARRCSDAEIFARVPHPYETAHSAEIGEGDDPLFGRFRQLMAALAEEDRGGATIP